mmetsp:Transcript_23948/g.36469  ORF Transcript_23948/g.36469 Transcript_23948/m.36469 type:complete len:752 (-) Transcript_23948:108-2363(-)
MSEDELSTSKHKISSNDLAKFQMNIEKKLRQPFTALELPKSLSTTTTSNSGNGGANANLTPYQFISNLQECFCLMSKPIQLRCLIGLLGFEPDVAKLYEDDPDDFDQALRNFLEAYKAEKRDDNWVQTMSGIISGKLFRNDKGEDLNSSTNGNGILESSGRNKTADNIIKRATESIIKSITEASSDALKSRNQAEVSLTTSASSTEEDEKQMEILLDSFQIGTDMKPHYVPWCFRLCEEKLVTGALPEIEERCDFIVNEEAAILKVDERLDRKKAEEEKKEIEQKEKMKRLAEERDKLSKKANVSGAKNGNKGTIQMRGVAGSVGRGIASTSKNDAAALMMRSKKKAGINGNQISGRLGGGTAAGGRPRKAGLGRGAAADAIGGKSLANPMGRLHKPGMARSMLGSASRRKGTNASSGSLGTSSVRATLRNKTKMRMIDVAEVEGLKKEEENRKKVSVEEARENRKRKILEKAAAKGLVSKKKWSGNQEKNSGNEKKEESASIPDVVPAQNQIDVPVSLPINSATTGLVNPDNSTPNVPNNSNNDFQPQSYGIPQQVNQNPVQFNESFKSELLQQQIHPPAGHVHPAVSGRDMTMDQPPSYRIATAAQFPPRLNASRPVQHLPNQALPLHHNMQPSFQAPLQHPAHLQHPAQQPLQQYQTPIPQQELIQQNWQELLLKSNKLKTDDRYRVEHFFTNRYNPTPEISIYKMKLNEEKNFDATTNQTIKETLYIELDYTTGRFKTLRKLKNTQH